MALLSGMPNPLTDAAPTTDGGKVMDIVISIWSLALAGRPGQISLRRRHVS